MEHNSGQSDCGPERLQSMESMPPNYFEQGLGSSAQTNRSAYTATPAIPTLNHSLRPLSDNPTLIELRNHWQQGHSVELMTKLVRKARTTSPDDIARVWGFLRPVHAFDVLSTAARFLALQGLASQNDLDDIITRRGNFVRCLAASTVPYPFNILTKLPALHGMPHRPAYHLHLSSLGSTTGTQATPGPSAFVAAIANAAAPPLPKGPKPYKTTNKNLPEPFEDALLLASYRLLGGLVCRRNPRQILCRAFEFCEDPEFGENEHTLLVFKEFCEHSDIFKHFDRDEIVNCAGWAIETWKFNQCLRKIGTFLAFLIEALANIDDEEWTEIVKRNCKSEE